MVLDLKRKEGETARERERERERERKKEEGCKASSQVDRLDMTESTA